MTAEAARAAAKEELGLAREELRAAEQLLTARLVRVAATRVYYAVFHAARALVYSEGLEPKTHAGVLSLLNVHFVRAGRLDAADSRLFARLQKFREEADYADAYVEDEPATRQDLAEAAAFVDRASRMMAPVP
jgi:uncharacterized protein (UPF0332 family)